MNILEKCLSSPHFSGLPDRGGSWWAGPGRGSCGWILRLPGPYAGRAAPGPTVRAALMSAVRIDKYLWAVRLFKTRELAADACRRGTVTIAGNAVKPSRQVRALLILEVKRETLVCRYRVLAVLDKRVGAKLVGEYLEDLTPPEDYARAAEARAARRAVPGAHRDGGRPTKKQRRDLEKLLAPTDDREKHFRKLLKKRDS